MLVRHSCITSRLGILVYTRQNRICTTSRLQDDTHFSWAHVYPVDQPFLLDQSTSEGTAPPSFRSCKKRLLKGLPALRVYMSMQMTAPATHHSLKEPWDSFDPQWQITFSGSWQSIEVIQLEILSSNHHLTL